MMDANAHATTRAFEIRQAFKIVCEGVMVVMSNVRDIFAVEITMISKIWPT